jgi:hypothetical protein
MPQREASAGDGGYETSSVSGHWDEVEPVVQPTMQASRQSDYGRLQWSAQPLKEYQTPDQRSGPVGIRLWWSYHRERTV